MYIIFKFLPNQSVRFVILRERYNNFFLDFVILNSYPIKYLNTYYKNL